MEEEGMQLRSDTAAKQRIQKLRDQIAAKTAQIEALRIENEKMEQTTKRWERATRYLEREVEAFTRLHNLPPPSSYKKK